MRDAGGLATLLEKKSRRMELALYCTSHAIMSFALCLVRRPDVRGANLLYHPNALCVL